MNKRIRTPFLISAAVVLATLGAASVAQALTADDAQTLARQSGCFKCHAVEKKKDAPAYRDVAAKYAGSKDAEAKLTNHITSGERVKFEDGHEEDHKVVKSKDPVAIKNLVDWILSLPGGTKY